MFRYILVGGDVVHFHRVGQAGVGHTSRHVDFVFVHCGSEQRAGSFHGSQLLPLKFVGVVDTHVLQALPRERGERGGSLTHLPGTAGGTDSCSALPLVWGMTPWFLLVFDLLVVSFATNDVDEVLVRHHCVAVDRVGEGIGFTPLEGPGSGKDGRQEDL